MGIGCAQEIGAASPESVRGTYGFAGLFKTASNLCVACGLIFKGLIGYFSMINQHSILRRKPLKTRPLLNQGAIQFEMPSFKDRQKLMQGEKYQAKILLAVTTSS
jgi:hypothetical protein